MENIRLNNALQAIPDLRKRLRKLRWFISAFGVHANLVEQEIGVEFAIDEGRLNDVFFDWTDSLGDNREGVETDLRDFVAFAAGLALGALVRHDPARPVDADQTRPPIDLWSSNRTEVNADVWPAGFLYVNFCLSVIAALEEQEFGRTLSRIHDDASDPLFWGSLYENVSADSRLAVPYLDLILGKEPNFDEPHQVMKRLAMQRALARRGSTPATSR